MSSEFEFPRLVTDERIVTGAMRAARKRTFAVHSESPLVVWSGRHRIGKSTTAQWLEETINEECAKKPNDAAAFRALHYQVGEIPNVPIAAKLAIRGLISATVGPPDRGVYLQSSPDDLARLAVAGLRRLNIRMVFIDEAGLLSLRAIGGLVQVRDLAKKKEWPLTLVLIGMDDLPIKLQQRPQIFGRVHDWISFDPYTLDETAELLAKIHPVFADLDPEDEVLRWIHEQFEGVPGEMVPFVRRVAAHLAGRVLSVSLLKAVDSIMIRDRKQMTSDSKKWSRARG